MKKWKKGWKMQKKGIKKWKKDRKRRLRKLGKGGKEGKEKMEERQEKVKGEILRNLKEIRKFPFLHERQQQKMSIEFL